MGRGCLLVRADSGVSQNQLVQRLDRVVPNGTSAVILQPGGNDRRKGSPDRTSEIQSRLKARGIAVIMIADKRAGKAKTISLKRISASSSDR